jgi:hypothetical protein
LQTPKSRKDDEKKNRKKEKKKEQSNTSGLWWKKWILKPFFNSNEPVAFNSRICFKIS